MMTIIAMLSFQLGLILFFFDRKWERERSSARRQFVQTIIDQSDISVEEKLKTVKRFYKINGIDAKIRNKEVLIAYKHFNLAVALMGFGIAYIGLAVYMLYFFMIQKPKRGVVTLGAEAKEADFI